MSSSPNFVERLRPLIAGRPRGEQLFIAALLESAAADRYRAWAAATSDEETAAGLETCAEREDVIAGTVRAHFAVELKKPDDFAALLGAIQQEVEALFGGLGFEEQAAIQAAAERGGEQLWSELAEAEPDPATKAVLLECAGLEASSAAFLEEMLAKR